MQDKSESLESITTVLNLRLQRVVGGDKALVVGAMVVAIKVMVARAVMVAAMKGRGGASLVMVAHRNEN